MFELSRHETSEVISNPSPLNSVDQTQSNFISMNYVMVGLIALVQGTLDIVLLAYFYIYLYDHKACPYELALIQAIAFLPWVLKPIFGLVSDRIKFLGYHRKSYIFAISLLEFSMHTLIFQYQFSKSVIITCNILQVACVCFRNAIGGRIES